MKSIFALVLLGFLAFAAAEELDLDATEKDLQKSPLVEVQAPTGQDNGCRCTGAQHCMCCATPKIFGIKLNGCINFSYDPAGHLLSIELNALRNLIVKTQFRTTRLENMCGNLPGRASILGFCFKTETTETAAGGLLSCSNLELKVKNTSAAYVSFACLNIDNRGRISFPGAGESNEASPVRIRVKNPLKFVVEFIRKMIHKRRAIEQ